MRFWKDVIVVLMVQIVVSHQWETDEELEALFEDRVHISGRQLVLQRCRPNLTPGLRDSGFCVGINDLDDVCFALEVSQSRNCTGPGLQFCCYRSVEQGNRLETTTTPRTNSISTTTSVVRTSTTSSLATSGRPSQTSSSSVVISDSTVPTQSSTLTTTTPPNSTPTTVTLPTITTQGLTSTPSSTTTTTVSTTTSSQSSTTPTSTVATVTVPTIIPTTTPGTTPPTTGVTPISVTTTPSTTSTTAATNTPTTTTVTATPTTTTVTTTPTTTTTTTTPTTTATTTPTTTTTTRTTTSAPTQPTTTQIPTTPSPGNSVPQTPAVVDVTLPETQAAIVNFHNTVRRTVTRANQVGFNGRPLPPASNMRSLSWDTTIAANAQRWADQCQGIEHSPENQNQGPGENTAATNSITPNLTNTLGQWERERSNFDYVRDANSELCVGQRRRGVIGHWTQMIWAETSRVGCGIKFCDPFNILPTANIRRGWLMVCQYEEGGNEGSQICAPYRQGPPCGGCGGLNDPRCVNFLCTSLS